MKNLRWKGTASRKIEARECRAIFNFLGFDAMDLNETTGHPDKGGLNSTFQIRHSALKKTPEGALPGLDAGLKMKAELHFHNFCGLRPFGAFDDLEFHLLPFR
jgi:hypothetical protein